MSKQNNSNPSPEEVREMVSYAHKRDISVTIRQVEIIPDEVSYQGSQDKINNWIKNATKKLASRNFKVVDIRKYNSNATMVLYEFTIGLDNIDEIGQIGGIRV